MQSAAKTVFQVLFLIILFLIGMSCAYGGARLDAWRLWCGFMETVQGHREMLLWASVIALQFGIMKWTGALWNILFSLMSILLIAWLVMLSAGQEAAVTSVLYDQMDAMLLGNALSRYPALLYLVPVLWFVACLCAQEQVRTFCTALICYGLWHALTAAGTAGLRYWQAMENPPHADALQNFICCPWLTAAIPGCFLLLYALLMAASEAAFPRKRPVKQDKCP